jgi:MYXO-CTERM domain-containing protein
VAGGYKDIFAPASARDTGIADIRDEVRAYIRADSPVSARLDGRISSGSATASPATQPAELPRTCGAQPEPALALLGLLLLTAGFAARRRLRRY